MGNAERTLAEAMDAHRVPGEMDAALNRVRERMFASHVVAGRAVGRYVLIAAIGEGGMGSVMRAYDPRLQREVALKRLRSSRSADLRGRLLREARAMAKLGHPNVVSVYDVELIDNELVIAMEYVRGTDLHRWLQQTRTPAEILAAFVEAGRGLGAAHAAGLVHRDFKPANALVDEAGRVQVTDFGLVRDASEDVPSTASAGASSDSTLDDLQMDRTSEHIVVGTPRYMAPEQERGREIDLRADIYAFCVALWEALAGEPPFHGTTLAQLRLAKLSTSPRWPKAVPVRAEVLRALERGLQPRPTDRWPTMAALLSAIEPRDKARGYWWLALPIAAVVTVPAIVASTASSEPLCEPDAGPSWSADRPAVTERLAALETEYAQDVATRALAKLDGFASDWRERQVRACDAKLDSKARELELACLGVGRARLESVVGILATVSTQELPNVHRLLAGLPDLSRCSDRESSLAQGSRDGAEVRRIERQIAASHDLDVLGRSADALREAEAAMESARTAGLQSQWLDARLHVAAVYIHQSRFDEATVLLRETLSLALQRGEDRFAARAAAVLGSLLASRGSSTAEGITLTQLALDLAPRTQDNVSWTAAFYSNAAVALTNAGRADEAADFGIEALRISREGGLQDTAQHVELLAFAAGPLCQAGRDAEGLAAADDAVSLARQLLGEHHPQVGGPLCTRGMCQVSVGDTDAGVADYREALAIFEKAYGPQDERVGVVLDNLGLTLAQNGDPFEAEQVMRRSLAIKARLYDEHHLQTAHAQEGLAYALRFQGRFGEAEALFEASLKTRVANLGDETVPVLHSYLGLADLAAEQGLADRAAEFLDAAERIARATVEPDSEFFGAIESVRERLN